MLASPSALDSDWICNRLARAALSAAELSGMSTNIAIANAHQAFGAPSNPMDVALYGRAVS
jgi:hypothetical protein